MRSQLSKRWTEYYSDLYSIKLNIKTLCCKNTTHKDNTDTPSIMREEVEVIIWSLIHNKSLGRNNITAEHLKHEGQETTKAAIIT